MLNPLRPSSVRDLSPPAKLAAYLVLGFWALVVLLPLYWLAITSFKLPIHVNAGPVYLPFVDFQPSLDAWRYIFVDLRNDTVRPFVNTVVVALGSSTLALLLGSAAAYALIRFPYQPRVGVLALFAGCLLLAAAAAGLGVPDGDLIHYVDQVDTVHPVLVRDWTGVRAPLHAVSSGQVLLAFRTPAAIERYLDRPMERFTSSTLVDPDAVRDRLRDVRRRGFSWAIEEFDADISSVAAPIADASGEVIAAVHVHGPSYRFPAKGSEADLAQLVVTGAARIAAGLRET